MPQPSNSSASRPALLGCNLELHPMAATCSGGLSWCSALWAALCPNGVPHGVTELAAALPFSDR